MPMKRSNSPLHICNEICFQQIKLVMLLVENVFLIQLVADLRDLGEVLRYIIILLRIRISLECTL